MESRKRPAQTIEAKTAGSDTDNGGGDSHGPPSPAPDPTHPEPRVCPDHQSTHSMDSEMQSRLRAFLEVAGVKLSHVDTHTFQDPEILRKLTNCVSNALDEAALALNRMRSKQEDGEDQSNDQEQRGGVGGGGDEVNKELTQSQATGKQQFTDIQALQHLLGQAGQGIHETTEDGESLLSLACSAGYFELAEVLLRMRASVEDKGIKGDSTPLMEAASGGFVDIIELLIDHGAKVNATSSVGNTALTYACCGGFEDVVKVLLDNAASVEHQNENGHTPLMEAASCGHVGVAKLLLEYGANINTHSNEFKESALTLACYKGHLEMVKFLLDAGADQEHKTDEMHTALMEACMDGHVEVARLLLDHGAQVNMPVDSFESPLTLAACGGHYELAALLLSRGADLEEVNDEGYTPLMEAAREGHEEVVQLLVEHGANVNTQTEETQETALTLACCGGFLEVAQFLVDHGADIELGASTPLMEAAQEGHIDIVKYLINKKANVHAVTNTSDSALTYACANGHTAIAEILLSCGANVEHESEGGRTPLMKAVRAGHLETAQFLIARGADFNRCTINNDHTVLSLACSGGHLGVVQYLLMKGADSTHILKDNSTMIIEAARGGHTGVVSLLLRQPRISETLRCQMMAQRQLQALAAGNIPSSLRTAAKTIGATTATATKRKQQLRNGVSEVTKPQKSSRGEELNEGAGLQNWNSLQYNSQQQQSTGTDQVPVGGYPQQVPLPSMASFPVNSPVKEYTTAPSSHPPPTQSMAAAHSMNAAGSAPSSYPLPTQSVVTSPSMHLSSTDPSSHTTPPTQPVHSAPSSQEACQKILGSVSFPSEPASGETVSTRIVDQSKFEPLPLAARTLPLQPHPQLNPAGGEYLLPAVFSESSAYSNQERMEAYLKADEILRNHMSQLDFPKQQALMNALENLMVQSEAHRASMCIPPEQQRSSLQQPSTDGGDMTHLLSKNPLSYPPPAPPTGVGGAWSFTDPSKMPQFAMGISTVAPTLNYSPDKHTSAASSNSSPIKAKGMTDAHSEPHPPSVFSLSPSKAVPDQTVPAPPTLEDDHTLETDESLCPPAPPTLVNHGQFFQPIYSPSLGGGFKHLSHRPIPAVIDHQQLVDEHSLSNSFLLDTNFPIDIPPPADLIPDHLQHMLPPKVFSSLMEESSDFVPSSLDGGGGAIDPEEEEEVDEEEEIESERVYIPSDGSIAPNLSPPSSSTTAGAATGNEATYDVSIEIDQHTESNHDTALTLAAAGGHDDLVELLLARGANIEHRDKKGCTPLILAANAGHAMTVAILMEHEADIEAQTDRTKDTGLSLACSSGRQEVVELLLAKGANYEHRNVSDYTPLSLAASGGYVNIIKLLLKAGADINSRTGSKLGISPLMLAAMNGHTSTVKLLLDYGSDINAQIETNRNTALTLACFQGRHEVVSLLVERQANVEHRAKTGLTPLMEAASGGYHEVGYVLICKGADVNAAPVPSSRDSALTIAADKGHYKFVDLLLREGAQVDVKNKKGNSPLWLAANGGHLDVIKLLVDHSADVDTQDNRKVCALMAAFRKGHYKVVKYLVEHVTQFPSDADLNRYINTLSDKDLIKKCQRCMEVIIQAKERQAAEANKNASILLQQLDLEKQHEENKKAAAARKRARKKKQKEKKQALKALVNTRKDGSLEDDDEEEEPPPSELDPPPQTDKLTTSNKNPPPTPPPDNLSAVENREPNNGTAPAHAKDTPTQVAPMQTAPPAAPTTNPPNERIKPKALLPTPTTKALANIVMRTPSLSTASLSAATWPPRVSEEAVPSTLSLPAMKVSAASSPRKSKKDEGWKEVGKRYTVTKKITMPAYKFSQVAGRGNGRLANIRSLSGAQIEVEKCKRQAPMRVVIVKGTHEAVKQAITCINSLQKDANTDITQLFPSKQQQQQTSINPAARSTNNTPTFSAFEEAPPKRDTPWLSSAHALNDSSSISGKTPLIQHQQAADIIQSTSTSKSKGTKPPTQDKKLTNFVLVSDKVAPPPVVTETASLPISIPSSAVGVVPTARSGAVRQLFVDASTTPTYQSIATSKVGVAGGSKGGVSVSGMSPPSDSSLRGNTQRPPLIKSNSLETSGGEKSMKSSVKLTTIAPAPTTAGTGAVSSSRDQHSQNVFEQIMKTPSIFQEAASQITQPKRYSDAVGKKSTGNETSGGSVAPSSSKASYSVVMGGAAPPTSVTTTNSGSVSAKLNLAPGSRPTGSEPLKVHTSNPQSIITSLSNEQTQSTRSRPNLWAESTATHNIDSSFKVPTGSPISPNFLGPIGPPSRHSKAPPPPLSPIMQGSPLSTSPKSPLLGAAPVGLLPLPVDKAFRPIHPEGSSSQNMVATKVPTPVRNNRPPLLATPPGFPSSQLLSGGPFGHNRSPLSKKSKPMSPFPSSISDTPDQSTAPPAPAPPAAVTSGGSNCSSSSSGSSPIKCSQSQLLPPPPPKPPSAAQSSNFNPNAPSFVPMAAIGGPPNSVTSGLAQTTSSILGNPPATFKYSIPVPIGSSLLGNMPSGRVMSSPVVLNPPHPPPPPPPGPPGGPPLMGNQPSLLGNPPFHLLVPPPPNRPPVYFEGGAPPPPHLIPPNIPPPTQFPPPGPPHTPGGMLPREPHPPPDQFVLPGDSLPPHSVFGFPPYDKGEVPLVPTAMTDESPSDPWNQYGSLGLPIAPPPAAAANTGVTNDIESPHGFQLHSAPFHHSNIDKNDSNSAFTPVPSLITSALRNSTRPVVPVAAAGNNSLVNNFLPAPPPPGDTPTTLILTGSTTGLMLTSAIDTSNVWSPYIGAGSDEIGWNSNPVNKEQSCNWPSPQAPPIAPPTNNCLSSQDSSPNSSIDPTSGSAHIDNLSSLLERLGLEKYHGLFQKNEIDHHALLLMSEKDFAEVGIPKGPRVKLLNAIGRKETDYSDQESDDVINYNDEIDSNSLPAATAATISGSSSHH